MNTLTKLSVLTSVVLPQAATAAELLVPRQYPTIAAATGAANPGDTILVSPGTYAETFSLVKPLTVIGVGGAEKTVVIGTSIAMHIAALGSGSVVEGFTFTTSNPTTSNAVSISAADFEVHECIFRDNGGPGVVVGATGDGAGLFVGCHFLNNASWGGLPGAGLRQGPMNSVPVPPISLVDCTFTGNVSERDGGGAWVRNASFTGCHFEANEAGEDIMDFLNADLGGAVLVRGTAAFNGCTFIGNANSALATDVFFDDTELSVTNCTFTGNSGAVGGGAICCFKALAVENSTFTGNSSTGPGGAVLVIGPGSTATVEGSTFEGNTAQHGGALTSNAAGAQVTVVDCLITGNSAEFMGGGISCFGPDTVLDVIGCTITGNAAPTGGGVQVTEGFGAVASITGSEICDNEADNVDGLFTDGGGNTICADPADADIDQDGDVDGADLGLLLADWGSPVDLVADLNNDVNVNGADLGLLLAAWTG